MLSQDIREIHRVIVQTMNSIPPQDVVALFTPEEIHGFLLLFLGVAKLLKAKCNLYEQPNNPQALDERHIAAFLDCIDVLCFIQDSNIDKAKKDCLAYFLDELSSDNQKLATYHSHLTAKTHKQRANLLVATMKKASQDLKKALIWELQENQLFNSFRGVMKAFFDCSNIYTACFQKLLAIKHSPDIEKDLEYFQSTFTYNAKKMLFWIEAFDIKSKCESYCIGEGEWKNYLNF